MRDALRLHQMAKPAVYLWVRRLAAGDFVAAEDIAHAGQVGRRLAAGSMIMDRTGGLAIRRGAAG